MMFFAFSCLFTLSPQNMADAKAQNIPVLSYLANHFASMSGSKSNRVVRGEAVYRCVHCGEQLVAK